MIISSKQAFVWIWLPEATQPIVAGKLEADNGNIRFNYGKSYLERQNNTLNVTNSMAIYKPELPLQAGILPLLNGLKMPNCIRDAAPDAWGRRVIINRKFGTKGENIDPIELNELTYLLASGSDRIGALDFQHSATEYIPRSATNVSLIELMQSAQRVQNGEPLTLELDLALYHGSSIGGARPKALIEGENKKYIAKFSSSSDLYNIVKAEFIAMKLAALAGLDVAAVKLTTAANKDVLLIERFDRKKTTAGWTRKAMVSVLTLLSLDEMMARYASYETLAEIIRHRFINPKNALKELFSRLIFNILCGNTDDHARNHAAFWDGENLCLTPAYDICPQGRSGTIVGQAMLIHGKNNLSQLKTCIQSAHNFLLSKDQALMIYHNQKTIIENNWDQVCSEAKLNEVDKNLLYGRQFLNPFIEEA